MKPKYFTASYGDFIKFDKKPNEDFYLLSKKFSIFAVADGVTQSHYSNGDCVFPEGAKEAAEIFCRATVEYLEENLDLKSAFNFANEKIKELNEKYGIDKKMDYVIYDWFDAVGAAGFILENKLFYGYVGDCGLIIFDSNNKKKFQTKDAVAPAVKKFRETYKNWKKFSKNQRTELMHKDFRNNPNKKGYGSFTGEKSVENYYKFGAKDLAKDDLIVFYTDGTAKLLKDKNFIEILRKKNKKNLDKFILKKAEENEQAYGCDRTFIAVKIEA
ncbi:MAG: PP2C family serine/threonine-protein phosphatase [Patescibacteria group bacterium]